MDKGSKATEQTACLWDHGLFSRAEEQSAGCGCQAGGRLAHEGSLEHKKAWYYSECNWWKVS